MLPPFNLFKSSTLLSSYQIALRKSHGTIAHLCSTYHTMPTTIRFLALGEEFVVLGEEHFALDQELFALDQELIFGEGFGEGCEPLPELQGGLGGFYPP